MSVSGSSVASSNAPSVLSSVLTLTSNTTGSKGSSQHQKTDESANNSWLSQIKKLYRDLSACEAKLSKEVFDPQEETKVVLKSRNQPNQQNAHNERLLRMIAEHKQYVLGVRNSLPLPISDLRFHFQLHRHLPHLPYANAIAARACLRPRVPNPMQHPYTVVGVHPSPARDAAAHVLGVTHRPRALFRLHLFCLWLLFVSLRGTAAQLVQVILARSTRRSCPVQNGPCCASRAVISGRSSNFGAVSNSGRSSRSRRRRRTNKRKRFCQPIHWRSSRSRLRT
jgi:hypothetical protein